MLSPIMDAHIHLDRYTDLDSKVLIESLQTIECTHLIAVGSDLASCQKIRAFAEVYPCVLPAFGYHPEQRLPDLLEETALLRWMEQHQEEMVAIGEIGLPTYLKRAQPDLNLQGYIELLEHFLELAKKWDKPVVLHAVYEEAELVCDLLENAGVVKAHFHWFKGSKQTMERMQARGYYISIPPEIVYRKKIHSIATCYPLEQIMMETDGPWPYEGKFAGEKTHPYMIHEAIQTLSSVIQKPVELVYEQVYKNTQTFYQTKSHNR